MAQPPLPEYYDPPEVRKTPFTNSEGDNEQTVTTETSSDQQFNLADLDQLLDRIEEFEQKQARLNEVNEQLRQYDDLVAERQQLTEWLEQNADLPAQAKVAQRLGQRLAERFGKPDTE